MSFTIRTSLCWRRRRAGALLFDIRRRYAPVQRDVCIPDESTVVLDDDFRRIAHLRGGEIFVFSLAQKVTAKTVAHRVMRPRGDTRFHRQFVQALRESIDIALGAYRTTRLPMRIQPREQVVGNTHEATLARLCFDP